jgi:type IV pilus assembly protein PilM
MSFLDQLRNLVDEPPPAFAFEIGPAGLSHWQQGKVRHEQIVGLDHAVDAEALAATLRSVTPAPSGNRKRPAALILPDNAARVALMDFDQFPRKAEEQVGLLRFRLKRTVPFDVDTAIIRYQTTPRSGNKVDVTVAAIAVETLAPYEAAFRNAGFHPGFITVAGLMTANLAAPNTITVRLAGHTLTLCYFDQQSLRLFRCVDLPNISLDEILTIVDPSLAYLEDELQTKPQRIDCCGLGNLTTIFTDHMHANWKVDVQPLRGKSAVVESHNAGLYGYLDALGVH